MSANGKIIEIRFGPLQCLSMSDDWKDRTKMCTIIFQYIIWFQRKRMFTFLQNPDKWIGTIGDMFRVAIKHWLCISVNKYHVLSLWRFHFVWNSPNSSTCKKTPQKIGILCDRKLNSLGNSHQISYTTSYKIWLSVLE